MIKSVAPRTWWRRGMLWGLAALTGLLTACGGGGGGGGGDDFKVRLDRSEIAITVERGGSAAPAVVKATLEGKLPDGLVYIGTQGDHDGLLTAELSFPDTRTAVASVYANGTAAAGTYSGSLRFYLCKDVGCSAQYTAPVSVRYTVTVLPGFELTPASLDLSTTSGQTTRTAVGVQLPAGSSDYAIDSGSLPSWLTVSDRSASGFTVSTGKMPAGTYNAFLQLRTPAGRSAGLPLTLRLSAPPGGEHNLILSGTSFDLATVEGASTTAALGVNPPTWGPELSVAVNYTTGGASGWLSLVPASGGYTLQASAAALPAGVYQAMVLITGDLYTQGQTVYVSLTVGPGLTQAAPRSVTVNAETTASALAGTVPIQLAGGAARTWNASSDSPWLVLDTASGSTGSTLAWHIDRTRLDALANASSQAATVTVDAGSPLTPMHFTVTLDKALPAAVYAMPATRLPGQTGTVYVRGSGFAALADPAARVSVAGVSGVSVTRVNDSELALSWPGAAAGNYTVAISNALNLSVATAQVQVQAAASVPPTRIAQTGQKTGLIHDVARRALLVLNLEAGTIQRYAYGSGSWVQSSASLASLVAFALSPDGNTLVATTSQGVVHLLDPATLSLRSSHPYGTPFYQWAAMDANLPVTNDGKVWLAAGTGWNQLVSFDLRTQRFDLAPLNGVSTSFYYGPWGQVSGDGERLLLSQTAGLSPQPPMLYLDARDGLLHTAPLTDQYGGSFFYDASYSDNGRDASGRLVLHNSQVYDGQFASIGRATLPSGIAHTSVLSADGRTLYVLSLPDAFWLNSTAPQDRLATVWVFDARAPAPGTLELPLLGSFTLGQDYTCAYTGQYDDPCGRKPRIKVAPDGNTLFIAGPTAVLAVDIPGSVPRVAAAAVSKAGKAASRANVTPTRQVRRWGMPSTAPVPPRPQR